MLIVFDHWFTFPDNSAVDFVFRDYHDRHAELATMFHRHMNELSLYLSSIRKFSKFDKLCLYALDLALHDMEIELNLEQREEIVERLHRLQYYDDLSDCLQQLKDDHHTLVLHTGTSISAAKETLERNGIKQIDHIISAEDHYPALFPSMDPIKYMSQKFIEEGLINSTSEIVFVSGSPYSCGAVKSSNIPGLKAVRVVRPPRALACFGFSPCPNKVVNNFQQLTSVVQELSL
ncbi:hypothetical protein RCL1_006822 [Eukaryota sp. TZLM3-RCL]